MQTPPGAEAGQTELHPPRIAPIAQMSPLAAKGGRATHGTLASLRSSSWSVSLYGFPAFRASPEACLLHPQPSTLRRFGQIATHSTSFDTICDLRALRREVTVSHLHRHNTPPQDGSLDPRKTQWFLTPTPCPGFTFWTQPVRKTNLCCLESASQKLDLAQKSSSNQIDHQIQIFKTVRSWIEWRQPLLAA